MRGSGCILDRNTVCPSNPRLDEGTVVTIHMRAVPYAETAEGEKIHVK